MHQHHRQAQTRRQRRIEGGQLPLLEEQEDYRRHRYQHSRQQHHRLRQRSNHRKLHRLPGDKGDFPHQGMFNVQMGISHLGGDQHHSQRKHGGEHNSDGSLLLDATGMEPLD
ncbi:hypothetical protein D3C75_1131580 [compost metagenome]